MADHELYSGGNDERYAQEAFVDQPAKCAAPSVVYGALTPVATACDGHTALAGGFLRLTPRSETGYQMHEHARHDAISSRVVGELSGEMVERGLTAMNLGHVVFPVTRTFEIQFCPTRLQRARDGQLCEGVFCPSTLPCVGEVVKMDAADGAPIFTAMAGQADVDHDALCRAIARIADLPLPVDAAGIVGARVVSADCGEFPFDLGVRVTGVESRESALAGRFAFVVPGDGAYTPSPKTCGELRVPRPAADPAHYGTFATVDPAIDASFTISVQTAPESSASEDVRYMQPAQRQLVEILTKGRKEEVAAFGVKGMGKERPTVTVAGVTGIAERIAELQKTMCIHPIDNVLLTAAPAGYKDWEAATTALGDLPHLPGISPSEVNYTLRAKLELDVVFPRIAYALTAMVCSAYKEELAQKGEGAPAQPPAQGASSKQGKKHKGKKRK